MTTTVTEQTTKEMAPRHKQEVAGAESTHPGPVFTPAMDVFETESAIVMLADMPGVRADGLGIDLFELFQMRIQAVQLFVDAKTLETSMASKKTGRGLPALSTMRMWSKLLRLSSLHLLAKKSGATTRFSTPVKIGIILR